MADVDFALDQIKLFLNCYDADPVPDPDKSSASPDRKILPTLFLSFSNVASPRQCRDAGLGAVYTYMISIR
jgi:hypothetical protein